ncbi:hypothetical protein M1583_01160 [Candidatus Marsarchaeota archaeon]|nr:hypothetical protein [Candidatus Marsarchaeota archaeon]
MESKQKRSGVQEGELKQKFAEEICDEQKLEQSFAEELKEMDFGPMIAALINEEPDSSTKAAITNALAQSAIRMVKKAKVISRRKQIRFGPAAVVMAAKE